MAGPTLLSFEYRRSRRWMSTILLVQALPTSADKFVLQMFERDVLVGGSWAVSMHALSDTKNMVAAREPGNLT